MKPRRWSASDESKLRRKYPFQTMAKLVASMKRTSASIKSRAKLLGLKKNPAVPNIGAKKEWSPADDALLRKLYPNTATKEMGLIYLTP